MSSDTFLFGDDHVMARKGCRAPDGKTDHTCADDQNLHEPNP